MHNAYAKMATQISQHALMPKGAAACTLQPREVRLEARGQEPIARHIQVEPVQEEIGEVDVLSRLAFRQGMVSRRDVRRAQVREVPQHG